MDSRDSRPTTRTSSSVTLQLSSGALLLAAMLVGLVIALAIAAAFLAGMALQQATPQPSAPAVTIVTLPAPSPALAAPVAQAAYPAPEAPAPASEPPVPTAAPAVNEPPVFAPIRPTVAEARGLSAPDAAPLPTQAPADFQLAPAGAQPAPTIAPAPVVVQNAPAQIAPAPAIPAPAQAVPLPTEEPAAPTAVPPRNAAANRSSGDDTAGQLPAARPVAHRIGRNETWTASRGPIVLRGDLEVARGASLIIGEGVEVQIPRGASLIVNGNLYVLGTNARPARITQIGGDRSQRWEAIFARPGSSLALNNVEISGGGAGGTLLGAELSDVKIRGARLINNGGQIRLFDSRIEVRDSEIRDNEMPYGAAIDVTFTRGGAFTLTNSRLVRNGLTSGSAPVLVVNQSFQYPTTLEITGNLLVGQDGPNLQLFTNAQMQGNITCNTLTGGANGLSLRSDAPPNLSPMINLRDNAIEGHTPPIIDIYLEFGIGRGATSDLPLGMANNWWEVDSGPYEPDRNNAGRGEAVGDTVTFTPWLTKRPTCAPSL